MYLNEVSSLDTMGWFVSDSDLSFEKLQINGTFFGRKQNMMN